jgi:UDP-N-acetylglucosamine/UDP-N-acetylgalactosamine 4-epimerase
MPPARLNILVTGGAGFIGSHLVDALLTDSRIAQVRVLDNLATGTFNNLAQHQDNPRFEWMEGDIRSYETCLKACAGIQLVSHQAALGSVPRSIADPLTTHAVNATGMLHILEAAKNQGVKRVVYAASSSTYGDSAVLPKQEAVIGRPLSPYAVTKLANELYAGVYHRQFGLDVIGLRYFNIFGPRQLPEGAYAAAIPRFIRLLMQGDTPVLYGDGSHSRDFTYVANAVQANLLALFTQNPLATDGVFNIAYGQRTTLLQLLAMLQEQLDVAIDPIFEPARNGDVPHSLADISKAKTCLGYAPTVGVAEGLAHTLAWHKAQTFQLPT